MYTAKSFNRWIIHDKETAVDQACLSHDLCNLCDTEYDEFIMCNQAH